MKAAPNENDSAARKGSGRQTTRCDDARRRWLTSEELPPINGPPLAEPRHSAWHFRNKFNRFLRRIGSAARIRHLQPSTGAAGQSKEPPVS
jgi:hypothetical protein